MAAIESEGVLRDVLLQTEAARRAERVREVAYRLALDLRAGATEYGGRATIDLSVVPDADPLFLDFSGKVTELRIDGEEVAADHRGHRLYLPGDRLGERSRVEVAYRNAFDRTGDGFHRFVDPEDGDEYVHSHFEPFDAHRLFPCFDQPDLKATYELDVTAPADWQVVSAMPAPSTHRLGDGRVRHRFDVTPRFSTYLLALVAGPYERVGSVHDGIPLGLYGRRSMGRILEREADELFEITAQGLDLYRRLFGQPFAFAKYDQLFVPEFNAGAMENVGAVTFHDSFLFRDPPTDAQRMERAEVLLHELAHMWFGDLVTMRWWDDLWLNESFATYVSFGALARGTRFTGAWKRFNGAMKPAAYRQDQLVTTHPIATAVPDTDAAQMNFDAIVYEKGAAVLKQLVATIGESAFADGVRTYFRRHAWGTATLADFLAALGSAAGRDLDGWANAWLGTAGLDTVAVSWEEQDGRITRMEVRQTPAEGRPPAGRSHAMQVGLLGEAGGRLVVDPLPLLLDGPVARVDAAVGRPAPLLVFPNHDDHDYSGVLLDERSLAFVRERIGEVDDPLLRQQLWSTLWEMVRDARLSSIDFLAVARRFAPLEEDAELLDAVLAHVSACLRAYIPEASREGEADRFVEAALGIVERASAGDLGLTWLRFAAGLAETPAQLGPLLALADRPAGDGGLAIHQDVRWTLAVAASAAGIADAEQRIAREAQRDPSDRGARARLRAEVARPEAAGKAEAWRRIHAEGYGSDHLTSAAMQGFTWVGQRALLALYRDGFFERVREVAATHDHSFVRAYLAGLFPGRWAEPEVAARTRGLIAALGPDETIPERLLREEVDDLERMIRVRAFAESRAGG